MRILYILLLFLCWLPTGWTQLEDEDFGEFEIEPPFGEEEYEYQEVDAVFDLEAVQTEPLSKRQFDQNKWEQLRQQNDYTQEKKPPPPKEREDHSAAPWNLESAVPFITIMLYAMVIVVIALVLYFLLRPAPKDRKLAKAKATQAIDLENIEENLEQADVEAFIAEAEAAANYQQATRLHFLASLKTLSANGLLKWKKDKTNRTYFRELRQTAPYAEFKRLSLIYERVWYGQQRPDAQRYAQLRQDFVAFRQSIRPLSPSHVE